MWALGGAFDAFSQGNQEDCALAFGVRRKEIHDIVVIEGESGGAETLGIGSQVEAATDESSFELGGAIAAIAIGGDDPVQIG